MNENNLYIVKEILFRLANDEDITLDEVRTLAEKAYITIYYHNQELKDIYFTISKMTLI